MRRYGNTRYLDGWKAWAFLTVLFAVFFVVGLAIGMLAR